MSLLYLEKDKIRTQAEIKVLDNGDIIIDFYSNCGKFGTDEMLSGFVLSPDRLMKILAEREDITEKELG